ncbi:hypothetical protein [Celeribacter sp.]|uniref:hypothetical protein n=1 Tax=Celeribacter sp. TaxID=1890673 RepID=UPI003A906D38
MSNKRQHSQTQPSPIAAGAFSKNPRRMIQKIQSGAVIKDAMKELSRAMDFANAVGENFAAVLPDLNEQTRIEVFSALACNASSKDRRAITEHPQCPAVVKEIVEKHDAKKAEEARADKAKREAERKKKDRAKYEELRKQFGDSPAKDGEAGADE